MMPYGYGGLPGDRLTGGQGARLAALLARQNLNNGSNAGGLAHALQQGLMGLMMKRDMDAADTAKEQQAQSTRNLAKALEQGQGIPKETRTYGDGTTINWNPVKPDPNAMMQTLASDPINSRLASQLMMAQAAEQMKPETFGAASPAIGPDGKPALVQMGNRGTVRPAEGFQPAPGMMGQNTPSTVAEWSFFNALSPQDQERFLTMKRSNPYINLGGSMAQPSQTQPGALNAELPKSLPPEETPGVKAAQAQATAEGKGRGELAAAGGKKGADAVRTLDMLDGIEALIDKSTGSFAGAARDVAGQAVGVSTEGSQAAAELQVIQAGLILSMPRLEGPQSDRDTMLYRQAAGMIGDPTVPADTRKAAVKMIRTINEKYKAASQGKPGGQMPAPGGPSPSGAPPAIKFLGFEGQ